MMENGHTDQAKFQYKLKNGDIIRRTYFLGAKVQKQKIGQRWKWRHYYNKLKCPECDRVFRTRHGVESHALTLHGLKLEGETKGKTGGKSKNTKQNRKPRKVIKEESFSSDNSSEVEVKTRVIIQPKKKKSKVETVDHETAQCMSMLPEFNPKVVLRDIYLFNETSYQLPEKAETQERVEEPESKKEFVRRIRNQSQSSCKKIKIEADHDVDDEPSCSWSGWPRPPSTCKKSEDSDSDDIVCLN